MGSRLRPITLSRAHLLYLVLTLLMLAAVVGILGETGFRQFYARHVALPPLAREFGFSLRADPGWATLDGITPGGVFDRVGLRPDDMPLADERDGLHHGLSDFLGVLEQARAGRRVEVVVVASRDRHQRPEPLRCAWIDLNDLRAHPEKRSEAVPCGEPDWEVRASLSGYGLLWPAADCCAFELTIKGTLEATLVVEQNTGRRPATTTHRFRVTDAAWNAIGETIRASQFFDLPESIGASGVDAPARTLSVSRGDKSHAVALGGCDSRPQNEAERRACAVWSAVTNQIPLPEVTQR